MVEIECLVCGEPIKIPSCIVSEDYDGQLFCHECNLLWNIKLKSSKVIKYKLAEKQPEVKSNTKIISGIPRPKEGKEK